MDRTTTTAAAAAAAAATRTTTATTHPLIGAVKPVQVLNPVKLDSAVLKHHKPLMPTMPDLLVHAPRVLNLKSIIHLLLCLQFLSLLCIIPLLGCSRSCISFCLGYPLS